MNGKYGTTPQPSFTADVIVSIIPSLQSGERVIFSIQKFEFVKSFDIGKKCLILVPFWAGIFRRGYEYVAGQDVDSNDKQFPWIAFFNAHQAVEVFLVNVPDKTFRHNMDMRIDNYFHSSLHYVPSIQMVSLIMIVLRLVNDLISVKLASSMVKV